MRYELRIGLVVTGALVLIVTAISLVLQGGLLNQATASGPAWRQIVAMAGLVAVGVASVAQGVTAIAEEVERWHPANLPKQSRDSMRPDVAECKIQRTDNNQRVSDMALRVAEKQNAHRALSEAWENLLLIEERRNEFVLQVDVPLQLVKEERRLRKQIRDLESEACRTQTNDPI